ncbi:MAG: DegT/DnrJ/EryC1/StrS family aminotransferase [Acaryochloridaceae cyanobacterium RU_4_10]|nr:DegT/DnrJ/EryC1/StrS family aminotransferase [Acaryochloridaceae cyanobacterium RU_4_10]
MILMNDFQSEPIEIREAMMLATQRVFNSGHYVLGEELQKFEQIWAQTCRVAYGLGVGSGLDAIEIALRALNIGPSDEVITTPMTAFATVLAIIRAGATPVLADIEPDTALLSIQSVRRCLSPRTKAVLLVHLYGQVRCMQEWLDFCNSNDIALIEDCAQAHLAQWQGQYAGTFSRVGTYSFYPTKNLGAIGDGGMVVTNDETLARKVVCLRNYGQSQRYHHSELGMNSRLDELQAALLIERLKWLPEFTRRRREIASAYHTGLCHPKVRLLALPQEKSSHVYHLFPIVCEHRNELQAHLQANNIQSLIHYPIPIHQQEICRSLARDPHGLINSEYHANTCLSIPCHPQMSNHDLSQVIDVINSFK